MGSAAVYEPGERVHTAGCQAGEMAGGAAGSGGGVAVRAAAVRRYGQFGGERRKKAEKSDKTLEKIVQQCQVGQQVQSRVKQRVRRWARG